MMAVDGSCMDVADGAVNAEFFGNPAASHGQSAFPQARVLALVKCGTHAVVAASIAPYSWRTTGSRWCVREPVRKLT